MSLPSLCQAGDLATGAEVKGGAATCPARSITGGTEVSPKRPTHLPGIPGLSVCVESLPVNEWKKEENVLPGWQCLISGLFRLYTGIGGGGGGGVEGRGRSFLKCRF